MVPKGLRVWFIVHFIADVLFAVPLLLAPEWILGVLGWITIDPFGSRLVGAALMGIGVESLLGRNASLDTFRAMLNLKIIWSLSAITGIMLTMLQGGPAAGWAVLAIFATFSAVWIFYRVRLGAARR